MKASRFSEAQKAFILKQGVAGTPMRDTINFINTNASSVVVGLSVRLTGSLAVETSFGNAWDVSTKVVLGSSDLNYQYTMIITMELRSIS